MKVTEEICDIIRVCYKTDLETVLSAINASKVKALKSGYSDLELWMHHDSGGMTDLSLHGSRPKTEEELDIEERVKVIFRQLSVTSKGLTREDLLK